MFQLRRYRRHHHRTSQLMDHRFHFLCQCHQHLMQLHQYQLQYLKHHLKPDLLHVDYHHHRHLPLILNHSVKNLMKNPQNPNR